MPDGVEIELNHDGPLGNPNDVTFTLWLLAAFLAMIFFVIEFLL
jgi:hypothetical protein